LKKLKFVQVLRVTTSFKFFQQQKLDLINEKFFQEIDFFSAAYYVSNSSGLKIRAILMLN
jgi:hypothetical protein